MNEFIRLFGMVILVLTITASLIGITSKIGHTDKDFQNMHKWSEE